MIYFLFPGVMSRLNQENGCGHVMLQLINSRQCVSLKRKIVILLKKKCQTLHQY